MEILHFFKYLVPSNTNDWLKNEWTYKYSSQFRNKSLWTAKSEYY